MVEIPKRLWLPLFMLDVVGPIYTKTKFQKLAFLIQYLSKIDEYDFKKHHYGPYSDTFDLDTACYPALIEHTVNESMYYYGRHYHTYDITDNGKEFLTEIKKNISPLDMERVKENVMKYKDKNHCELLEEVYSKFAIKHVDSIQLMQEVKDELVHIKPTLIQCYMTYHNRQSTFILATLELIEIALLALENVDDTVRKGVVLNLSKELIQKCKDAAKYLLPPDSEYLRPQFIEMAELESFLREYCDTRNIMKDPLKLPINEIITEDEAERLSKALSDLKLAA